MQLLTQVCMCGCLIFFFLVLFWVCVIYLVDVCVCFVLFSTMTLCLEMAGNWRQRCLEKWRFMLQQTPIVLNASAYANDLGLFLYHFYICFVLFCHTFFIFNLKKAKIKYTNKQKNK